MDILQCFNFLCVNATCRLMRFIARNYSTYRYYLTALNHNNTDMKLAE